MIVAIARLAGWLFADRKDGFRIHRPARADAASARLCRAHDHNADFPVDAAEKWDWAWKALAFAIFLPFTLRTKLRIEAALLFLTLSAAAIIIVGGIKTVLSGGGYGVLNLMVDNNSGLYESSTISTLAIGLIPVILWFARYGTIYPPDWRVKLFCAGLVFACLLIPIGTEARTGLVCIAVLGILMLRDVKRAVPLLAGAALLGAASIPFLPASFTSRMETIQGFQGDQSANTRLAVWAWTWDYARAHPFGGGFGAYRGNRIQVQTTSAQTTGEVQVVTAQTEADEGRAYHSAYFEMLGEQGFPGLFLFLIIHAIGLIRMEIIRRRYRRLTGENAWIAPLASALQHFQIIYLIGAVFVAIAYQPFVYLILGAQIGFDCWLRRTFGRKSGEAFAAPAAAAANATASQAA